MLKIGYAQEIITPPVGVGLAGYFNERPNIGMYDDLFVKAVIMEKDGKSFGFLAFDLCSVAKPLFEELEKQIVAKFGQEFFNGLVISATHTHTGSKFLDPESSDLLKLAFKYTVDGALRALERAVLGLQPGDLEVGSVYNNPYGFVRRYWMKSGDIVTNPGWGNPDIDKPECDYDRTIGILKIKQHGRIAALLCNIANHGDTVGGNLVSADWYGRFVLEVQHALKCSLPVLVLDDASGNINHFDVSTDMDQTRYAEAERIGTGYAETIRKYWDKLEAVSGKGLSCHSRKVKSKPREIDPVEMAEAKEIVAKYPDIDVSSPESVKDLTSEDLAKGTPFALKYFAVNLLKQAKKSEKPEFLLTCIKFGDSAVIASLPSVPLKSPLRHYLQKSHP